MKIRSLFRIVALLVALLLVASTFVACDMLALTTGAGTMKGPKGDPGTSVTSVYIDSNGHLIVILSDGSQIDAGSVSQTEETNDGENNNEENNNEENNNDATQYTVSGAVYEADSRSAVANAQIIIYSDEAYSSLVTSVTSSTDGTYSVSLPAGTYYVKIVAQGFISFESIQEIRNEDTFLESYLMVQGNDGDTSTTGSVGGQIVNSVTGGVVDEATLSVRKGWNQTSGDIITTITTDANGNYNLTLPIGNYTIIIEKASFVFNYINIVVTTTPNTDGNASIVPDGDSGIPTGDLRVVLSWGEYPLDLDSHMIGPTVDESGKFHIYYNDKTYSYSGETKAFLDVDDRQSYGPETTTVYSMNNTGIYRYLIHDYSNKDSTTSNDLSMSGAKVQVYVGTELIATYNVPASKAGTEWHVFDFDASTRRIIPVNEFNFVSEPQDIGRFMGQ